jgi:sec-independent protein translocase protein TatA
MAPSWWQILLVVALFVLLFGRGKISELMGDVAKGIKSFKAGMSDENDEAAQSETKAIEHDRPKPQPRTKAAPRAKAPRKSG